VKVALFFVDFDEFDEMGVIEGFDDLVFGAVLGDLLLGEILLYDFKKGVLGVGVEGEGIAAVVSVNYLHVLMRIIG
jgi:hypothetical protein